jgi:Tn3 transposase DDE domain
VKFNELLANCVIYQNACDITAAANALAADGRAVDPDDLVTIAPYITQAIRRFGDWVLDLSLPEAAPVTALNLAPGRTVPQLFPGGRFDPYPGRPRTQRCLFQAPRIPSMRCTARVTPSSAPTFWAMTGTT